MSDKISKATNLNSECTLRCDNHFSVLISKLRNLFAQKKFVDVALVVEGQYIKAHRIMLIAFSLFFEEHFSNLPGDTPKEVVLQGVRADHIKALIQYMYTGEVTIARDELPLLLKTASFLKMEGFDMEAQEDDMISIMNQKSGLIDTNNISGRNDELVIKKEPEYDRAEAVGSSDENYLRFASPLMSIKIGQELMDIGDQQSQEKDYAEVMVLGSVGILNQLPIPISFKRRYSDDVEEEGANDTKKKEEIIELRDRTMEQHQITEYDEKSEFSEHSSLNDDDDISPISVFSADEGTSPSSKVKPSHILENQGVIPLKKKKISAVVKTVPERPFKCTNNCGVSYKTKGDFNRHVRYECGVEAQFPCPQCGHRFSRKWNLRQHLTKMHSIDSSLQEPLDNGHDTRPLYDFKCDKCKRTYKNKESLLRHVRRECGVEPSVACNRCKFRTAHSSDLKKHLKNVHGLPDGADPGSHQFS